jgi:uncharacterized protein (DUF2384 family)
MVTSAGVGGVLRRIDGGDQAMKSKERAVVFMALRELFSDEEARAWLNTTHPQLKGRTPLECEYREVIAIIDQLRSGAFA